uniref:Uncharacterized protein n=1 Tax=Anguilla anguilla TaxID=7936 RepID=A0A0E9TV34_ANGAN
MGRLLKESGMTFREGGGPENTSCSGQIVVPPS